MLSWLHQVYGKMLYLPTDIFTIDGTSVVNSAKIGGDWGDLAPPRDGGKTIPNK